MCDSRRPTEGADSAPPDGLDPYGYFRPLTCSACSLPAVRDGLCAGHDRLATQDYSEIAANE